MVGRSGDNGRFTRRRGGRGDQPALEWGVVRVSIYSVRLRLRSVSKPSG